MESERNGWEQTGRTHRESIKELTEGKDVLARETKLLKKSLDEGKKQNIGT